MARTVLVRSTWNDQLELQPVNRRRHRSVRCAVHQTVGNLAEEAGTGLATWIK